MSETKFTPGPWTVESGGISSAKGYADVARIQEGRVYSELTADPAELEIDPANAALIAAAPVLYAALDDLVDAVLHDVDKSARLARAQAALNLARDPHQ